MVRQFAGHIGDVNSLSWFPNSDFLISGGSDSIVRVWSINFEDCPHAILNEHSQSIEAVFSVSASKIMAVNRSGLILVWIKNEKNSYTVDNRASIPNGVGYVTSASFANSTLCLGLSGGAFSLYDVHTLSAIQSLSVGACVSSVALSVQGDWVAVGISELGQLLVWEWKSETFILKQQGHFDGVNCVAFSGTAKTGSTDLLEAFSNGIFSSSGVMATGGIEGKIKLWHSSGLCFATLADHTASIEALAFTPQGNAILSASMDGSVRAFDLVRYKNFRTFTAPDARVQFGSLAIDQSGELVAAGAANGSYSIYLWSLQTGQCLDVLSGHEARISNLRFSPSGDGGTLVSSSWDSSMKVWSVFGHRNKGGAPESLLTQREVTCAAFDPVDGSILAVATTSGHITFWDVRNGIEVGAIEGVRDIASGRKNGDKFASAALKGKKSKIDATGTQMNLNQYFSNIQYGGAAGRWLAAVSKSSPFLCIYDPLEKTLISRVCLTTHFGLSGTKQFLNSKFDIADTGNGHVQDGYDELDRAGKRGRGKTSALALPGVERGDMKTHHTRTWRVSGLAISPDGQDCAVATSEGVFVLTLGASASCGFNPAALSEDVSHVAVESFLNDKNWISATISALSLNEAESFKLVFETVKKEHVAQCALAVPKLLYSAFLSNIALLMHPIDGTAKIELAMLWITEFLKLQFNALQLVVHSDRVAGREIRAALCSILQHVQTHSAGLGALLRDNTFMLGYLAAKLEGEEEEEDEDDEKDVHVSSLTKAVLDENK